MQEKGFSEVPLSKFNAIEKINYSKRLGKKEKGF